MKRIDRMRLIRQLLVASTRKVLQIKVTTWLAALFALSGAALPALSLKAQTPHSVPKSCGYAGGPTCPASAPFISPWTYRGTSFLMSSQFFNSIPEVVSWFQATVESGPSGWCTATYQGTTDLNQDSYQDGILVTDSGLRLDFWATGDKNYTPPCSGGGGGWTSSEYVQSHRTLSCPYPEGLHYQSSPLVGPYCQAASPPTDRPKQLGCSSCDRTVKGNPVDVSNGNKYETQIDYAGVGNNPLTFARSYNSLSGYMACCTGASPPPGATVLMGVAWSATYCQFLVPASVTDSTGTYNTVCAYSPDGRLFAFHQYGRA